MSSRLETIAGEVAAALGTPLVGELAAVGWSFVGKTALAERSQGPRLVWVRSTDEVRRPRQQEDKIRRSTLELGMGCDVYVFAPSDEAAETLEHELLSAISTAYTNGPYSVGDVDWSSEQVLAHGAAFRIPLQFAVPVVRETKSTTTTTAATGTVAVSNEYGQDPQVAETIAET